MGHHVGQDRGKDKTAQVYHTGFFPYNCQHFVGHAAGQPCLGKNHADDDGCKDKHYRRVHEVRESFFGGADKKMDLEDADGQASYPDRYDFKNPPYCGQQGY